ncbi:hypothetical protein OAO87_01320 [bacterium]|nr:hypothetical protein [bacterium]
MTPASARVQHVTADSGERPSERSAHHEVASNRAAGSGAERRRKALGHLGRPDGHERRCRGLW